MLNKKVIAAVLALPMIPFAGFAQGFYDDARVVSVKPAFRTESWSEPQQRCHEEQVYTPVRYETRTYSNPGATIVGALIGGFAGSQFGRGRGRVGSAIAGAAVGGTLGHAVTARTETYSTVSQPVTRQVCNTIYVNRQQQVADGFDVTYIYKNKAYQTHTQEHPGNRLKVFVNVSPVDAY